MAVMQCQERTGRERCQNDAKYVNPGLCEDHLRTNPAHVREVFEQAALEAYATLYEALDWGQKCGEVNFLRIPLSKAVSELHPVVLRLDRTEETP